MRVFIIPQELNISDRIGPFTIMQWVFIGGGLVATLVIFTLNINILLSILFGLLFLGGGLSLATIRIQGDPVYTFILNFVLFKTRPKTFIYSSDERLHFDFEDDKSYVEIDIF